MYYKDSLTRKQFTCKYKQKKICCTTKHNWII